MVAHIKFLKKCLQANTRWAFGIFLQGQNVRIIGAIAVKIQKAPYTALFSKDVMLESSLNQAKNATRDKRTTP